MKELESVSSETKNTGESNYNGEIKLLKQNGWTLIKNIFTESEVNYLRENAIKYAKTDLAENDLLSIDFSSSLFLNDKLIKIVTDVLNDKPVYFGDSGFQVASAYGRISNGFHKDSVDRKNDNGIDWQDGYSLIRVGIYLQDHENYSEGLVVRNKSFRHSSCLVGEKYNVPSKAGDVIVWYLTTTHSGNAKRLKWFNTPVLMGDDSGGWLSKQLYYHLPNFLFKPSQKDRIAFFMTFGKNDIHLKRYLQYLKFRKYMVNTWLKSNYVVGAVNEIKRNNKLEIIDCKEEASKINLDTFEEYDFNNFGKYEF